MNFSYLSSTIIKSYLFKFSELEIQWIIIMETIKIFQRYQSIDMNIFNDAI